MQPTITYEVRVDGDKVRTTDDLALATDAYNEFKASHGKAGVTLTEICISLLADSKGNSVC